MIHFLNGRLTICFVCALNLLRVNGNILDKLAVIHQFFMAAGSLVMNLRYVGLERMALFVSGGDLALRTKRDKGLGAIKFCGGRSTIRDPHKSRKWRTLTHMKSLQPFQ